MNAKLFSTLATAAVALASAAALSTAMAVEATQFEPSAGTKTRAEVQAELASARAGANVVQYGEATQFVDRVSTAPSAFAAADAQDSGVQVVRLGEATQFIDQPGTLTRAEVRAETLAAVRNARNYQY